MLHGSAEDIGCAGKVVAGLIVVGPHFAAARLPEEYRKETTMKTLLTRLVFGLWIVGAPFALLGCAEDSKPASPSPAPAPAETGKPADEAKK